MGRECSMHGGKERFRWNFGLEICRKQALGKFNMHEWERSGFHTKQVQWWAVVYIVLKL
jgi:hypothetical protein